MGDSTDEASSFGPYSPDEWCGGGARSNERSLVVSLSGWVFGVRQPSVQQIAQRGEEEAAVAQAGDHYSEGSERLVAAQVHEDV